MCKIFTNDMEIIKQRINKPAVTTIGFFVILILYVIFSQYDLGHFLSEELLGAIVTSFMLGGLWYGRNIVAEAGKAPVDINTGEEYYPGGFNGSVFRWGLAIALGATVGTVLFAVDAVRVIIYYVKRKGVKQG